MTTNPASDALGREVANMAAAARRIALELQEYAVALGSDDTLTRRLGDQHVGAPTVVQILHEVSERTQRPDFDSFHRVLAQQFADAQAGRS